MRSRRTRRFTWSPEAERELRNLAATDSGAFGELGNRLERVTKPDGACFCQAARGRIRMTHLPRDPVLAALFVERRDRKGFGLLLLHQGVFPPPADVLDAAESRLRGLPDW